MVMRLKLFLLPIVNIFFSPLLMLTARRCCVSAWAATSKNVRQQRTLPSLHPAFASIRCRGGSSHAPISTRSTSSVQATVRESSSSDVSASVPNPESLQHLGGGFTPRQFGGLAYCDTSTLDKFRVIFVLGGPGAGRHGVLF
jgi:hypothetical protein